MDYDNWYVSFHYPYFERERTIKILEALNYKKHKLLYGINYYYLNEMPCVLLKRVVENCVGHYSDSYLPIGKDTLKLERIIKDILFKRLDGLSIYPSIMEKNGLSIQNVLRELKNSVDKETLWEIKYAFCNLMYDGTTIPTGRVFTEDKIRFKKAEECSLSFHICNPEWQNDSTSKMPLSSYTWFEIDRESDILEVLYKELNIIITDDLGNINNYIYYLNIVEYNNFTFAIQDNKNRIDETLKTKLSAICKPDKEFKKFNFSMIRIEKIKGFKKISFISYTSVTVVRRSCIGA